MRRSAKTLSVLAAGLLLAGCGYDATSVTEADRDTGAADAPPAGSTFTPKPCSNDGTERLRSYRPAGSPDSLREAAINDLRDDDVLTVGIAADSYLLGFRNPLPDAGSTISGPLAAGQIQGFDIDMATRIANDLFGEPGHLRLRVITPADRIPLLQSGDIDMVSRNMTITCERWQQVAFSQEYYTSGQQVLVRSDNTKVKSEKDLAGLRVCAPAGTTSLETIKSIEGTIPVESSNDTDCLIRFQASQTDAISTDDTVLAGLAAQDPYAKVVPTIKLSDEPYGLAMGPESIALVQYVNYVLERMRADGTWQSSYQHWLQPSLGLGAGSKQPAPVYGRDGTAR